MAKESIGDWEIALVRRGRMRAFHFPRRLLQIGFGRDLQRTGAHPECEYEQRYPKRDDWDNEHDVSHFARNSSRRTTLVGRGWELWDTTRESYTSVRVSQIASPRDNPRRTVARRPASACASEGLVAAWYQRTFVTREASGSASRAGRDRAARRDRTAAPATGGHALAGEALRTSAAR